MGPYAILPCCSSSALELGHLHLGTFLSPVPVPGSRAQAFLSWPSFGHCSVRASLFLGLQGRVPPPDWLHPERWRGWEVRPCDSRYLFLRASLSFPTCRLLRQYRFLPHCCAHNRWHKVGCGKQSRSQALVTLGL